MSAAVIVSVTLSMASASDAASFVVGGFDAARGGIESLAPGENSALAADIVSAFPGTTFHFTNTLTPAFFGGINAVILGLGTGNFSSIAPLSGSEQVALRNFVLGGGTALIFSDNDTFESNAAAANANLLSPFGVTATGTLNGSVPAPIINPNGPLTGPFKPATAYQTFFPGFFSNTDGGQVLADLAGNPVEPAIDFFASGALGPTSGAVVLFSDSNEIAVGQPALTASTLNIILNAFALTGKGRERIPEPGTLALLGTALLGLALTRRCKNG